jgi:hypothetical protein
MKVRIEKNMEGQIKMVVSPETNEEMAKMEYWNGITDSIMRKLTIGQLNSPTGIGYEVMVK